VIALAVSWKTFILQLQLWLGTTV